MSSFGETLRRERELRGVSLREIADATKISVRFLQALERFLSLTKLAGVDTAAGMLVVDRVAQMKHFVEHHVLESEARS